MNVKANNAPLLCFLYSLRFQTDFNSSQEQQSRGLYFASITELAPGISPCINVGCSKGVISYTSAILVTITYVSLLPRHLYGHV